MVSILLWFVIQRFYPGSVPLLQHITPFPPPSPPSLSRACVCVLPVARSRAHPSQRARVHAPCVDVQPGGWARQNDVQIQSCTSLL